MNEQVMPKRAVKLPSGKYVAEDDIVRVTMKKLPPSGFLANKKSFIARIDDIQNFEKLMLDCSTDCHASIITVFFDSIEDIELVEVLNSADCN